MGKESTETRSNDPFRSVLRAPVEGKSDPELGEAYEDPSEESPIAFVTCSDFRAEKAHRHTELKGDIVAIGRPYIAK